jgi:hypothetical protein
MPREKRLTGETKAEAENLTSRVSRNEAVPAPAKPTHGETRRILLAADAVLGVGYPSKTGCWLLSTVWGDHTEGDRLPCRHSSSYETGFLYKET